MSLTRRRWQPETKHRDAFRPKTGKSTQGKQRCATVWHTTPSVPKQANVPRESKDVPQYGIRRLPFQSMQKYPRKAKMCHSMTYDAFRSKACKSTQGKQRCATVWHTTPSVLKHAKVPKESKDVPQYGIRRLPFQSIQKYPRKAKMCHSMA
jgi:hypothetical protein